MIASITLIGFDDMPTKKKRQYLSKNIKLTFYQRKKKKKNSNTTEQRFKLLPPSFHNDKN